MYAATSTPPAAQHRSPGSGYGVLATVLALVIVLNLFDMVATIIWIELGLAREANPFMNYLLQIHPTLFAAVKLALVSAAVMILWRYRQHAAAHVAAGMSCALYLGTYAIHAYGAIMLPI